MGDTARSFPETLSVVATAAPRIWSLCWQPEVPVRIRFATTPHLPIKNILVLKVSAVDEEDLNLFEEAINSAASAVPFEGKLEHVAIAFLGQKRTSFMHLPGAG